MESGFYGIGVVMKNWYRPLLLLALPLLLVLGWFHGRSDQEQAPAPTAKPAVAVQSPLLWRIEGDTPQYLFGTIHLPDPRVTTLHPAVEQAYADSEIVLTELKLDLVTMSAAGKASLLPEGQQLSALLPEPLWQRLRDELRAIAGFLQPALFERMKPWAVAMQLSLLPVQLKNPGVAALDLQLAQRAEQLGKRNEGLEQLHEQIGIFDNLTLEEQAQLLDETLKVLQQARADQRDIIEALTLAYLSGEEQQLQAVLTEFDAEPTPLNDRLKQALIQDRNRVMAERVIARLQAAPEQRLFIAVGAAHLIGDDSVVALLRDQGYTVTRMH